jgi:drug/metabolite transporter (DMT)-like permease
MLCGSAAFALMGTLAHGLAHSCDWQVIALVRSGLALLFAALLALGAGARLVFLRPRILWVRSIAGSLSLVSTFFALTRLPVADVLTLTNLFPLWVALLSWPLLGEVPGRAVWIAAACALVGVALIQQPHLAEGNWASLVALASSFFTAVAMHGLHRLRGLDARAIVVHFSAVSVLFGVASFFLFEHSVPAHEVLAVPALLMLLGVGVTATIGQLLLTKAFAAGPPARVAIVGLTQIVFALGLDAVVGQRAFSPVTLLGIVLVVAPTAWVINTRS